MLQRVTESKTPPRDQVCFPFAKAERTVPNHHRRHDFLAYKEGLVTLSPIRAAEYNCLPAYAQARDAQCQWTYIAVAGPHKIQVACSPRMCTSCPNGQMPEQAYSPRECTTPSFITPRRSQKAQTVKSWLSWMPGKWYFW